MATGKFSEQRVGVLVDIQNMYYSAKVLYKKKVDFKEVLKTATSGRKLIRAIAYGIKTIEGLEKNFFDALQKSGYEVRTKGMWASQLTLSSLPGISMLSFW